MKKESIRFEKLQVLVPQNPIAALDAIKRFEPQLHILSRGFMMMLKLVGTGIRHVGQRKISADPTPNAVETLLNIRNEKNL
jgi:hypothetical protein